MSRAELTTGRHRKVAAQKYRARHRARRRSNLPEAASAAGVLVLAAAVAGLAPGPAQAQALPAPGGQHLISAISTVSARQAHAAMPRTYTVRSGDTLSAIAGRFYGNSALYPSLWWINKGIVHDPNAVRAGQRLRLSPWHPKAAWLAAAAGKADPPAVTLTVRATVHRARHAGSGGRIWGVTYGYPNYCGDGDGDGWDVACSSRGHGSSGYQVPARSSGRHSYRAVSSYRGTSSFESCVIARESGGSSQVMNASGHYGLYQFSEGTWVAYGGSADSFGHASVAEQRQVFGNAMARGGQSNWAPYDGC